jgi:hypothetical protein
MYYRTNYDINADNMTSMENYLNMKYGKIKESNLPLEEVEKTTKDYDIKSVNYYYSMRPENFIVGILSKGKNSNNTAHGTKDIFKIRPPLKISGDKKRGTGIYSLTGAVCATSKDKPFLLNTIKKLKHMVSLDITVKLTTREDMCNNIKILLLYLEKYATTKNDNKVTYMMIPQNHTVYPFPYNLEDRIKHILQKIKEVIGREYDYVVKKEHNGSFEGINKLPSYTIEIKTDKYIKEHIKELEKLFNIVESEHNKDYIIVVE